MFKNFVTLGIVIVFFTACEEVIDVDLNYSSERLVIEGHINWIKESQKTEQFILLSKTSPYFDNLREAASGAKVQITDLKNNIFEFTEKENTGIYYPLDTIPYNVGNELTLEILYENQQYIGSEILYPVASIYKIEQDSIPFFGSVRTQIEAYSIDSKKEDNYSYFEFLSDRLDDMVEYNVYRDDFSNGSEYYGVILDGDLEKNDTVRIRQYSLSKTAYQYWYLLILQNTQQGGPFQTNPANLNGNMINITRSENNPLGYFRVSEVSEIIYTVK